MSAVGQGTIHGRKCYVPRMGEGSTRLFCAALRGSGIDAHPVPESDRQTLELAGRHVSEQCYPQKVTLGSFLKIVTTPGFDAEKTALFMPGASGPCRFGQYALFTRKVLAEYDAEDVLLLSPVFDDGYAALGDDGVRTMRYGWWGLVAADLLRSALYRCRPHEIETGSADAVYQHFLNQLEEALASGSSSGTIFKRVKKLLRESAEAFEKLPVHAQPKPLIGIVGEIFCRLDDFSNEQIVRRIEAHGGEAWLAGLCEWVHYANYWEQVELKSSGSRFSWRRLRSWLSSRVQERDEQQLSAPYAKLLADRPEPGVATLLELAHPYLPAAAGLGEMTLSLGRTIYMQQHKADGVLDISPFTCMNGIVSEAIYPKLSREHGNIPVRSLYFDGTGHGEQTELELFMALASSHKKSKFSLE